MQFSTAGHKSYPQAEKPEKSGFLALFLKLSTIFTELSTGRPQIRVLPVNKM
jgi:hypothetical protein